MDNEIKDPVCNKPVNQEISQEAGLISNYKSQTFYFHSRECKEKFDANPDRYFHKRHVMRGGM